MPALPRAEEMKPGANDTQKATFVQLIRTPAKQTPSAGVWSLHSFVNTAMKTIKSKRVATSETGWKNTHWKKRAGG